MSDRKYRQRGYQDEPRDRAPRDATRPAPTRERGPREPRAPNLPGFRTIVRCSRCGHPATDAILLDTRCTRCGADLHACAQCVSFDTAAPFECVESIPVRISPKDARNTCTLFEARTTVERETGSSGPPDARKAFDDLFK
jgi:hypothetical protein